MGKSEGSTELEPDEYKKRRRIKIKRENLCVIVLFFFKFELKKGNNWIEIIFSKKLAAAPTNMKFKETYEKSFR